MAHTPIDEVGIGKGKPCIEEKGGGGLPTSSYSYHYFNAIFISSASRSNKKLK
jgi:hypothetical protein